MNREQAIYAGLCFVEPRLKNEQTARRKRVRVVSTDASQFRTNRMRTHTLNPKRDFDSIGRNTPLRGYCGVAR